MIMIIFNNLNGNKVTKITNKENGKNLNIKSN